MPVLEAQQAPVTQHREQTRSRGTGYYPWFDWLRLSLACMVLLAHEGILGWRYAGNLAVQVFFALSGWLIGGQLVTLSRRELPRFYFNRALRIWVPYFLAVTILVLLSAFRQHLTAKWFEIVFYDYTSVFNLFGVPQQLANPKAMPLDGTGGHFWSVNAEEQFYLLAPLVLVIVPSRLGRRVLAWACIACVAWVTRCYASIAFGVLAAVVAHHHGPFHTRRICRVASALVLGACLVAFMLHAEYDLVAPLCAIATVMFLAIEGRQHTGGELAAGMSYPLYLNAWIAVFATNALFRHFAIVNHAAHEACAVLLSLVLAAAIYMTVDRQVLARKKQLYTPTRAYATVCVAYAAVLAGIAVGLFLTIKH